MRLILLATLPFLLLACGSSTDAVAETEQPDSYTDVSVDESKTADTARIIPIMHGSIVFQSDDVNVYVDPYGGGELYEGLPAPDLVVITHPHGDHLDPKTLGALDISAAELLAPQAVIDKLGELSFDKITKMDNGDQLTRSGIMIDAMPMYNLPEDETSRHKKGWGNGYVITMGDRRHYISGDTEDIEEMRNLKDIDVAFVCMNIPYTMPVERAADAVSAFQPAIVYPYHYRNGDKTFGDVENFKKLVNSKTPDVEVRLANWYPK